MFGWDLIGVCWGFTKSRYSWMVCAVFVLVLCCAYRNLIIVLNVKRLSEGFSKASLSVNVSEVISWKLCFFLSLILFHSKIEKFHYHSQRMFWLWCVLYSALLCWVGWPSNQLNWCWMVAVNKVSFGSVFLIGSLCVCCSPTFISSNERSRIFLGKEQSLWLIPLRCLPSPVCQLYNWNHT